MMKLSATAFVLVMAVLALVGSAGLVQGQEAAKEYKWQLLSQVDEERRSCANGGDPLGYGRCLEKIIKKIATEFYPPEAFGEGGINAYIQEMRRPYQKTYWTIYNKAGPCGPTGCGLMSKNIHENRWDALLDNLLTDMVAHLKDHM